MVLSGIPSHWNWQDLKDHIRKYVDRQPGWTNVQPNYSTGALMGSFPITGRKDADKIYDRFAHPSNKKLLLIHRWELLPVSSTPRFLQCNCSSRFNDLTPGSHSPGRSGISPQVVARCLLSGQPSVPMAPVPATVAAPAYQYSYPQQLSQPIQYSLYSTPVAAATVALRAPAVVPAAVYSSTGSGVPVNVRHGAMLTESRGIFISGLSYAVGPSELDALLKIAGRPIRSELLRDPSTGKSKGIATAQFATKEEAQYAVSKLNNTEHMGMTVRVRLDKESTSVGQLQGPVIVDGSNGYRA